MTTTGYALHDSLLRLDLYLPFIQAVSVYVIAHPLLSSQVLASLPHVFLGVLLGYLLAILVRFLALLEAYYKVLFASHLESGRRFCLRCTEIRWFNSLHTAELSIGIGDWRRLGTQ